MPDFIIYLISQEEHRALHSRYYYSKPDDAPSHGEESRGKKRARAEDFL
jgi:hypothetical protein